jgi:TolB-like protein/Tfp pilus assembly protein PilF
LALLPPTNQSRDPAAARLVTSLIEDITIGFCVLNSIQVIAPYSAIQISRQSSDKLATFEQHEITYVLDTRLSEAERGLSLFSQLIYLATDEVVWAERFSLDGGDLARNNRDISRRLALSIAAEIDRHRITRAHFEQNPAAYHRYLIGRQHFARLTLPNLRRARKEMKAALKESPDFAPALSSIARTYSEEWFLTARGDRDLLKSAEAYALKAIAARDDLADGYRELGVVKLQQGALDESMEALELAETLSPHYADVIADHADTLAHCSHLEAACRKIEDAIELNPLSPDAYLWTAAGANYGLGRFETALAYIDQMAESSLADRLSAASWAMLGETKKARFFVRRVREANPDFDVERWLSVVPIKEQWHKDLYRDGLKKAGF